MLKVSVPLPVLVTALVNKTAVPGLPLATVELPIVTLALWVTLKGTVLDVPVTVVPEPSL